ncbi:MAG TPA: MotA/TolQ/ExbB proton channel family protein [Firmicutes bacterium]|nr:MotA/TolQ/ExbB proton channel family protein [Bacillota bacterium]
MLDIFVKGGPTMYALLACSIVSVAVILERIWFLWRQRQPADELFEEVREALSEGKVLEAMQLARQSDTPVASLLAVAIEHHDEGPEAVRRSLEQEGKEQAAELERGLPILDAIVTVAPLLGLLGTVLGIIRAFNVLGALQGVDDPGALSVGIAEALITTAAGLTIAIPTLIAHRYLSSVVDSIVTQMENKAEEILDLLSETETLGAVSPAEAAAAVESKVGV